MSPAVASDSLVYRATAKDAIAGLGSLYASAALADLPAGYWRLGESAGPAADSSGNGHSGTLSGGVTPLAAGAMALDPDRAMSFDGTGKIQGATTKILGGLASWSIEAWIKTSSTAGQEIYSERASSGNDILKAGISVSGATGKLGFVYRDDAGALNQIDLSAGSLADGIYHHCVVVNTAGSAQAFVDGAASGAPVLITGTTNFTNANMKAGIGCDIRTPTEFWIGSLDEVAIYPVALSVARIAAHYAARSITLGALAVAKDALA